MGTRGYFAFLYKGIYYIFYNNSDSYPEGLGVEFIGDYLQLTQAQFELLKQQITIIPLQKQSEGGEHSFHGLLHTAEMAIEGQMDYTTSNSEPDCDIFIEYVYIMDFDQDKFIVKSHHNELVFPLSNVPHNWIAFFNFE